MSPLQALKARQSRVANGLAVLGVFFGALAAAPASHASATDIANLVNEMRSMPSKCLGQPGLQKFVRRAELDRAAAMMAAGTSLQDSARATGYQSVPVRGFNMSGTVDTRALETLMANGYCPYLVDPAMAEMGVHQAGGITTVVLAAAYAPAVGMDETAISVRMLALVNEARSRGRNCGATFYPAAAPVRWNEVLARAARSHSDDMAKNNFFGHDSRNGTSSADRVERAGYDYGGTAENIAAGQMTTEAAMAAWLASPGHCANLMQADYLEMGAGMASNRQSEMGAYWTQVFGTPRVARPARAVRPGKS
ncbi:MAG: CAP domain-containing protein [Betaproteobacteria bacterium]